jgi:hypothetical protein
LSVEDQEEIDISDIKLKVWDDDRWTSTKTLIRHKQHPNTTMVMTRARNNKFIISQDNHPHMFAKNTAICQNCEIPYRKPKKTGR